MSAIALAQPWAKITKRNSWRAVTEGGFVLVVSRSLDGTWAANVDYPAGLFDRTGEAQKGCRTRLIAQSWAEQMAALRERPLR